MLKKILEVRSQLQKSLSGLRWVQQENLHLTLKFLGSVEENRVLPVIQALKESLHTVPGFIIGGKGIGVFPNVQRARVLWVGLTGQELHRLADRVETALEPLGFAREQRAFSPHLTLGRWRGSHPKAKMLKEQLALWQNHDFGESKVDQVVLFQSVLKPEGAIYSSLGEITLDSFETQQR